MSPRHASITPLHPLVEDGGRRRGVGDVQGTLALDIGRAEVARPPQVRGVRGTVRIVSPRPSPLPRQPGGIGAQVRVELDAWARRYAQAAVEVVNGDRPASQLLRWTEAEVFADLTRRAQLLARAGGQRDGERRRPRPVVRPMVRSAHLCFLAPGVAEVAVRVEHGARSRALALRFERTLEVARNMPLRPRWICTALDFS